MNNESEEVSEVESEEVVEEEFYSAQDVMDLIDELNPFGLSPVLSFTFVQIFISVVDLIFSFFDKTPNIEWIKTNTEKIFSIVGNLYRKEQLLELAKKAVELYYNLKSHNILTRDISVDIYKKHIIAIASVNNDALQFINYLAQNGNDELQIQFKHQQESLE